MHRTAGTNGKEPSRACGGLGIRLGCAAVLGLLVARAGAPGATAAGRLPRYETPYYVIHSDLDRETLREAAARMTAMAEEYHQRTKDFGRTVRRRLPFVLFAERADYEAAGGQPGSSGMYTGRALIADGSLAGSPHFWRVIQHEGFHQFAHTTISSRLPVWVDEGLAEYFAHGVWTGDGFVTGVIPPGRARKVQAMVRAEKLLPFERMIAMDRDAWNGALNVRNYDQAWSMVHFLVHADDGRYREAFVAFINDVARYRPVTRSFARRFGTDIDAFEKRYAEWWTSVPENPTRDLYDRATVATLTSYLARAHKAGQAFDDAEAFLAAGRGGKIEIDRSDWLPPGLLGDALERARRIGDWSLKTDGEMPALTLTRPDGAAMTGSFRYDRDGRVADVDVETAAPTDAATKPSSMPAS